MWHAWGRGEVFTEFWLGGPKGRDHWDNLGVGGRITSWRVFVNTVMNLPVPKNKAGFSLTSLVTINLSNKFCTMELVTKKFITVFTGVRR